MNKIVEKIVDLRSSGLILLIGLLFAGIICYGIYLSNPIIIFSPILVLVGILAIINFKPFYFLLVASIPISMNVILPNGLGLYIPTEPLMVGLIILFTFHLVVNHKKIDFSFFKHTLIVLLFLVWVWTGFNVIYSQTPLISLKFFIVKSWFIASFGLVSCLVVKTKKDFHIIFWMLFSSLMFTVIWTLVQHAFLDFSFKLVNKSMKPFYYNHIDYAVLITLFLPFCFYMKKFYEKGSVISLLLNVSILIFIIAIYFSYTRAAIICFLLMPVLYYIYNKNFTKQILIYAGIATILLSIFFVQKNNYLAFAPDYSSTVFHNKWNKHLQATVDFSDVSFMERIYRWVAAGRMIQEKPIVGFGAGGFYHHYKKYTVRSFRTYVSDNEEKSTVHNYFLLVLVEQGLIGFILFTALVVLALMRAQNLNKKDLSKEDRYLITAIYVSFVVILINNLIGDLIEVDKIGGLFFFEIALIINYDLKYNAIPVLKS